MGLWSCRVSFHMAVDVVTNEVRCPLPGLLGGNADSIKGVRLMMNPI